MPRALCLAALLLATALPAGAFDLQGHRGARGNAPENTLAAFQRALAIGVDTLELDVAVTADGVVVVSHDPFMNPVITRDAQGRWLPPGPGPLIHSLTLAQLQDYDVGRIRPDTPYARTFAGQVASDGQHVPTLASVFELVRRANAPVRLNIETKVDPTRPDDTVTPEAMVRALLKVVQDAGMGDRVSIQSFDWRTLRLVQQLAPAIPTVCLTVQAATTDTVRDARWTAGLRLDEHGSVPRLVRAAGCKAWSPNGSALTQPLVRQAQALGLQVIPWTIDAPADMERLIGWGVDGLITDHPDRAREVMRRRGMALPAGR